MNTISDAMSHTSWDKQALKVIVVNSTGGNGPLPFAQHAVTKCSWIYLLTLGYTLARITAIDTVENVNM